MTAGELKEKLKEIPDNAFVYLDDHAMPTPRGVANVEFDVMDGFAIYRTETGRISQQASSPIKIDVVTLTTYVKPEGGWTAELSDSSDLNGQAGTRSKSKRKKSKRK